MRIGLIGFGSVGQQLYTTLLENNYVEDSIFVFDDHVSCDGKRYFKFNDYKLDRFKDVHFIPTLGYLSKVLKRTILTFLIENNSIIFSFIHPSAFISKSATIGRGVIIYPLCNVDQGASIEDGSIILNSCVVAHHSVIGECSYLGPGVCLSGYVKIGKLCFIGTAASIANNITIGDNTTIAIGTCVTKDIGSGEFAIGNPFQLKDKLKLT